MIFRNFHFNICSINRKGIYLGAYEALHPSYNIDYQDINGKRDIGGDMKLVPLLPYDFIICTPPCNYWSKARGNRISKYSLDTKNLLPDMLDKLLHLGKPFIIENVRNKKRFNEECILPRDDCFVYFINRHTYFTNVKIGVDDILQRQDFKYGGRVIKYDDMIDTKHQGGFNVHNVIEKWLQTVINSKLIKRTLENTDIAYYLPLDELQTVGYFLETL